MCKTRQSLTLNVYLIKTMKIWQFWELTEAIVETKNSLQKFTDKVWHQSGLGMEEPI